MVEQAPIQNRSGGIQVIARASRIMQALSKQPNGLSLNALVQQVDLPKSTVQRILRALEEEQMVEPIRPGTGYRLGFAFSKMVRHSYENIISIIRNIMLKLSASIQETVALSTIHGHTTTVIDRIVAESELCVHFPLGNSLPAHSTSDGKMLLSTLSNTRITELVGQHPQKLTPNTLDLTHLIEQVEHIRHAGIAEDIEEHTLGISAASVLVSTDFEHYALTIVAPSVRYSARREEFYRKLIESQQEMQKKIG